MDAPDADPRRLRQSLRFLRRINRLLGYARQVAEPLLREMRGQARASPLTVLDIGTGSADVPRALLRRARRRGIRLRVVGLDWHPLTIADAAAQGREEELGLVRGDALRLPFADQAFDWASASLFLHHFPDAQGVDLLREMNRVAKQGVLIADLRRGRRAFAWIWLLTLLANPMARNDARVSVRQSFTRSEILDLCARAGLKHLDYRRCFGHRFTLFVRKN